MTKCELCGDPMPPGEEMFKFHGYSGPCPVAPAEPQTPEPPIVWGPDSSTIERPHGDKLTLTAGPVSSDARPARTLKDRGKIAEREQC